MKGMLVIGMIIAHSVQLLSKPSGVFWLFSTGVNLVTFSGFFFCFGYVFYVSYVSKPFADVKWKMLKTAWKTLLGYYIIALASLLILSPRFSGIPYQLSADKLVRLLTFAEVPWYTEFLLSFSLITILAVLLFGLFKWLATAWFPLLCVSAVCWLTAILLPDDLVLSGVPALLVGTRTYTLFPVVQYLPVFLFGLYFSRHRLVWNRTLFLLAMSGTALFIGYYVWNRAVPDEFLPSIYWIVGSYGLLYSCFLLSKWLEQKQIVFNRLLSIGKNTLFYLILSNLILFPMASLVQTQPATAFFIGIVVIFVIGFLISLIDQPKPALTKKKAAEESLLLSE